MSEEDGDASSDSDEADDDATLTDEADPRRQLELEFESVDGSDGRSSSNPRAGRPIEHKEDPKKQYVNRRARENYKKRKLGDVRIIKPTSAQRQRKRNEQKGALEARDAFTAGDMDEGSRLQALALNTSAGRKMFPSMAEKLGKLSAHRATGEAVCDVLRAGSVDASQKQAVIRLCTASMNPAEQTDFCEAANIQRKTMKAAHWPSRSTSSRDSPSSNPFSWKPNSRTTKIPDAIPGIEKVVVDFFYEHASVRSGAKTETMEIGLSMTNLRVKFFEEYPRLLRLLNNHSPLLLQKASTILSKGGNLTRFQSSLMAAVQQKQDPEFDEDKDETQRRDLAVGLEKIHLEKKRLGSNSAQTQFILFEKDRQANLEIEHAQETASIIQLTDDYDNEQTAEDADDEDDEADPQLDDSTKHVMYPPPSDRVFYRILKKYKIHWTSNIKKVECPIHDEGPLLSLERDKLTEKQFDVVDKLSVTRKALQAEKLSEVLKKSEAELQLELRELEALLRKLRDKEVLYANHLKQYEACRRTIKKIEANLGPGEAVMYRDFVAAYNCEGSKLQNLVLVVLWRETIGAPLQIWKFSNLCDDPNSRSADAYYVADVFDFYFGIQQGLQHSCPFFRQHGIKKIYVSGDHGPHFSSIKTMYNESTMKEKYDLEVVIFFLCSYHCFNRCDQAGVEPKKLAKEHGKCRQSVRSSAEVASVLNASRYHNSHATDFPRINRNEDRFPKLAKGDSLNLRKMCQVQYSFLDQHGQQASEAGVILCRLTPAVPGELGELFEVYDLLAEPIGGPLCRACSKFMQRPVRHGETQCPHLHTNTDDYSESVKIELRKSYPDPNRIHGPQHNKQWKQAGKLHQGKFPCRVIDSRGSTCMIGHHYNTANNSNKHMVAVHSLQADSLLLYPTTFVCTVAGCSKKFASEEKRDDHVKGHTTKPTTATKRKTTTVTAAVSTEPAAAVTHASSGSTLPNDANGGDDDAKVQTTTEVATAPAGTKPSSSFLAGRDANIARIAEEAKRLGLRALAAQVTAPRKRRNSSDSSDSEYSPSQDAAPPKKYNLRQRRRRVVSFRSPEAESEEASAEEAEVEKAKAVPMEKTIDFCVVFGENGNDEAEVWFGVATEGEDEEDEQEDGDRCVRWLEKGTDEVWRTKDATKFVSPEYVFTTKRVTLRHSAGKVYEHSAGQVYELKSEDVPTEQEHANYDEALKKKFAAPATVPARPSTARPSTPRTRVSGFCEKKWKDVAEWQQAPKSDLYHFTLKATECRVGYFFLMMCTATPEPTASESAAGNQRSFLVVGKVKTVNCTDQTFTYTLFSAVSPANAYSSSCVEGGWVCETHAAQKEPANHSDVFMYFSALTKMHRLPAAAKERARTLCAFLN